jgi:hypothetical protein
MLISSWNHFNHLIIYLLLWICLWFFYLIIFFILDVYVIYLIFELRRSLWLSIRENLNNVSIIYRIVFLILMEWYLFLRLRILFLILICNFLFIFFFVFKKLVVIRLYLFVVNFLLKIRSTVYVILRNLTLL